MKLATYKTSQSSSPALGVVQQNDIVDLQSCGLAGDMTQLLQAGIDVSAIEARLPEGRTIALADVQLQAPIMNPGKVLAIGLNYADHIAESGMDAPKHQVWFNKQHNCINSPYGDINLPVVSTKLDYEAELCLVISKTCKHVPKHRAHEVIGGYFCGNDVSVRDWQLRAQTFQIGKSFDTHGPIGPYLVTPDEVGDPHNLDIRCLVNGEERQHSNTKNLIFNCFDAVAHLSQAFTLDVGDVLFMGTPSGVGMAMKPPSFLAEGDVVRVEIEKLGAIENKVVLENGETIIGS
ncbi:MAG: fumarylacetoacetate hydrolase family protein [Gammaproteobacteria bacterium]|nr:fumarylacetoacetate hydrolase family protein [Gammaproteobacteria bacterium]